METVIAHVHAINGSTGYLPDGNETFPRAGLARDYAETLFGDTLCDGCLAEMRENLSAYSLHMFEDCSNDGPDGSACYAGADYVEITACEGDC